MKPWRTPGWAPFLVATLLAPGPTGLGQEARASSDLERGAAGDSSSVLRGRVVDANTEDPLYGAAVSLAQGPGGTQGLGTRISGRDGEFLFRRVPPGAYRVRVTLLGYRSLDDTLVVEPQRELDVALRLSVSPLELDPIVVVAEERRRNAARDPRPRAMGFGTFISREDIEARNPHNVSDLLRTVPGVTVYRAGPFGEGAVRFRGRCAPTVVMDGVRTSIDADLDLAVRPVDVEAIEVYKAPNVPIEYGAQACGAIVIWTRGGEGVGGTRITLGQVALAAGLLLLAFIGIS